MCDQCTNRLNVNVFIQIIISKLKMEIIQTHLKLKWKFFKTIFCCNTFCESIHITTKKDTKIVIYTNRKIVTINRLNLFAGFLEIK